MEYKLPEVWFQCVNKEVIGTGAYGTVYRVEDPDHNISAVKVLNIPSNDEEVQTIKYEMKEPKLVREYFTNLISDFMREIQIMETLKDTTNVVHLKSHYLESNAVDEKWTIYIQMEMLTSLARYCSIHVMPEEEVIRLGIDILKAIRDCNKKDIIHRDIKPYNIMVTEDGTFKLGDFGIARHVEKTVRSLSIRGTFSYMAPEVFHGESYDKTVDLYSLGLVMYRLMNKNRDPFVSTSKKLIYYKDKEEALKQRMEGKKIPPPVNASEELAEIILRACAYNVEDRYQCAEDMLKRLPKGGEAIILGHPTTKTGIDRIANFKKIIEEHPEFTIGAEDSSEGQLEIAMPKMENIIQAHPNMAVVMCVNDPTARGVIQALKAADMKGVLIYGVDGSPDAKKAIKEGDMTGTAAQSPINIGRIGVEMAYKILAGEPVEKHVPVPVTLITAENVDEFGVDGWQ